MRKRIFEIIELSKNNDKASSIYDSFMMIVIVLSLIPLAFKETNIVFTVIEQISVAIFMIDYVLRIITADYKMNKCSGGGVQRATAFLLYPITPMALIDLVVIIASLNFISAGYKVLKLFRLMRTFRVFRALKIARYSKSITIISNVMKKQKEPLLAVCALAVAYILLCALVIFNVEPETFDNFFSAIYWATVSLTTMGYGDIYPVTTIGQIVTMVSSFVGIAIVALPAGIITAGYMEEINKQ